MSINGSVGNIYENVALYSMNDPDPLPEFSSARIFVVIKFHRVEPSLPG